MAGEASVVMPESQYRKDQALVSRAKEVLGKTFGTSSEQVAETAEGMELWERGSRAKGGMKVAASYGAFDLLAGGALYALVTSDTFTNVKFFKEHWWAKPLLVALAGVALFRNRNTAFLGGAVLGVAGGLAYQAWRDHEAQQKQAKAGGAGAEKKESAGIDDAGWPWERRRWDVVEPARLVEPRRFWAPEGERVVERIYRV